MSGTYLGLTWSTSRGRETYGYPICRLDDAATCKRYRTMGGNYDLPGTVLGDWLQDNYADRLLAIADQAYAVGRSASDWTYGPDGLYGMAHYAYAQAGRGRVVIDGACGITSVERVAEAIGLELRHVVSRRGHLTGIIVTDTVTP